MSKLKMWKVKGGGWQVGVGIFQESAGRLFVFCLGERCGIGVASTVNCPMTLRDKVVADVWNNNAKFSGI